MRGGLEVALLSEDHVDMLCRLFERVFGHRVSAEHWRWKYLDPALMGSVNVGILADGVLLGHAGAMVFRSVHQGRPALMAQACDVMLDPQVRGALGRDGAYPTLLRGLTAYLQRMYPEGLFYGFPGVRPFRLGERLGFYRGTGPVLEYSLPTVRSAAKALALTELNWEDRRLDALWERFQSSLTCSAVKGRGYLGWRYARKPGANYRLLGLRGWTGLSGWVVVCVTDERLAVIDRLVDERRLAVVLERVRAWGHRKGLQRVTWWQSTAPDWAGADLCAEETGMIGVVMTASAPVYAKFMPAWQPGDSDVR